MTVARSLGRRRSAAAAARSTGSCASELGAGRRRRRRRRARRRRWPRRSRQLVAHLEEALEEAVVLDDGRPSPRSGRPGTRPARATTSCRSRSAWRRRTRAAMSSDVELGRCCASSARRGRPGPTPTARQAGGGPGHPVGVLGEGPLAPSRRRRPSSAGRPGRAWRGDRVEEARAATVWPVDGAVDVCARWRWSPCGPPAVAASAATASGAAGTVATR